MKNEDQIKKIYLKECRVQKVKEWLGILFFLIAIIVIVICYEVLSAPIKDHGEAAVISIIATLSVFTSLIITGYFYNRFLSKKLDRLWEQKKLLL